MARPASRSARSARRPWTTRGVTSYALFLESLRHAGDLAEFAVAAHRAGKPVAVYKLGRSEEAAALAVSHTVALAGEDREAEAFFRACGFVRACTSPLAARGHFGHCATS